MEAALELESDQILIYVPGLYTATGLCTSAAVTV